MLPPLEIKAGDQAIYIEGKIDRIDVLPGNFIKIIDYKSGREKFDLSEALGGWRLQLMLYLKAAIGGFEKRNLPAKPAGVFYFEITDAMINAGEYQDGALAEKIEGELRKLFKLDGIVLGDSSVIENIAGEFSGFSEILPVRKNKEGVISGTSENKMLTEDEFRCLTDSMEDVITGLCSSLAAGEASIKPKKTRYETACKYCDYLSICNFELSFDGCAYHVVK
jgi:ATP-dependent helicase/nuclease subunit B